MFGSIDIQLINISKNSEYSKGDGADVATESVVGFHHTSEATFLMHIKISANITAARLGNEHGCKKGHIVEV